MYKQTIQELDEVFCVAIKKVAEIGVPIHFSWSDAQESNAWVVYNDATRSYEICITKKLAMDIYKFLYVGNIFDSVIDKVLEIYSITESEKPHIKKILIFIILCICFFHELGHIINGHIVALGHVSSLSEYVNPGSVRRDGYASRSLYGADADTYSAISIALIMLTGFNIPCDERVKDDIAKQLTLLASIILFYFFGYTAEDESPDYPPYSWRLFNIQTIFLERFSDPHGQEIPTADIHITIDDRFWEEHLDETTKTILKATFEAIGQHSSRVGDIFSQEKLAQWYKFYKENLDMLRKCHETIKAQRNARQ